MQLARPLFVGTKFTVFQHLNKKKGFCSVVLGGKCDFMGVLCHFRGEIHTDESVHP